MPTFTRLPHLLLFATILASISPAGATPTEWHGSLDGTIGEKSAKTLDGYAHVRLRYYGRPGDLLGAMLSGIVETEDGEEEPTEVKKLVLEYDASGSGRGEWTPADFDEDRGAPHLNLKVPAGGAQDFRVRATKSAITERFRLEFAALTDGPEEPLFFVAVDRERATRQPKHFITYPVPVPRGGRPMEIEVLAEGFQPSIQLFPPGTDFSDPLSFKVMTANAARFRVHHRYHLESEGRFQLRVDGQADERGGEFTLRYWVALGVERID